MDTFPDSTRPDETEDPDEEVFINPDVTTLFRRWRNEKYAPEILPYDGPLIDNLCEITDFANEKIQEDLEGDESQDPNELDFVLRRIDLERVKYMLRDYLRIRLWKVTQYPQQYLEPAHSELLSSAERIFLRNYWDAKSEFLKFRLLGAMPVSKQKLDDKIDLLDMVRRPKLDSHVYVRVVKDVGRVEVPPTFTQESPTSAEPLDLGEGETWLLRYSVVRRFLIDPELDGTLELV